MKNRKPGDSAAKQVFEVGLLIQKTIPPREYLDVREGTGMPMLSGSRVI